MISGITSAQSQSASESLGKVAEFYIEHSYYGLHMIKVKNEPDPKIPDTFDAIAVFAIPLQDIKKAALITEKVTHSVVILVNTETGVGVMVEYTNNNKTGIVQLAPGILAKQQYSHVRNPYGQYRSLSNGFYKCNMAFYQLEMFNKWFTSISNYHYVVHNCQVYHRSLVATALTGYFMYNFRAKKSVWNQLWSSHEWFDGKSNVIKLRNEIKPSMLRTMMLRELVDAHKIARATINSVAIEYDSCCHCVIEPKNMDVLSVNDSKHMEVRVNEAISNADNEKLLSLMKECYSNRTVTSVLVDAFNALFALDNHFIVSAEDAELLYILHGLNGLHNESFLLYRSNIKAFLSAVGSLCTLDLIELQSAQRIILYSYGLNSKLKEFALQPGIMNQLISVVASLVKVEFNLLGVNRGIRSPTLRNEGRSLSFLADIFNLKIQILNQSMGCVLLDKFVRPELFRPVILYYENWQAEQYRKRDQSSAAVWYALQLVTSFPEPMFLRSIMYELFHPLPIIALRATNTARRTMTVSQFANPNRVLFAIERALVRGGTFLDFIYFLIKEVACELGSRDVNGCILFLHYLYILPSCVANNLLTCKMESPIICENVSLLELKKVHGIISDEECLLKLYLNMIVVTAPSSWIATHVSNVLLEVAFVLHKAIDENGCCYNLDGLEWILNAVRETMGPICQELLNPKHSKYALMEYMTAIHCFKNGCPWKSSLSQRDKYLWTASERFFQNVQQFIILRVLYNRIFELTQSTTFIEYSDLFSLEYSNDFLAIDDCGYIADDSNYDLNGVDYQTATFFSSYYMEHNDVFSRNVLFVQDPRKFLLIEKESSKVFLSSSLLFAEARRRVDSTRGVNFIVRSWTPPSSALGSLGMPKNKHAQTKNEHQVWEFALEMDSASTAALVIQYIYSKHVEFHESNLKKFNDELKSWMP